MTVRKSRPAELSFEKKDEPKMLTKKVEKRRTRADFPALTAAHAKLSELRAGRAAVASELAHVQSQAGRAERIEAAAADLLSGGGTALATLPDVAVLQERVASFDRAILRHEAEVLRPAQAEAVAAISSDHADAYREALESLFAVHGQLGVAIEHVAAVRRQCDSACGCRSNLPEVTVNGLALSQLRYSMEVMDEQTRRFRGVK